MNDTATAILTGAGIGAGALLVVIAIWIAILSASRSRRMARLDERVDLARGALVDALDRRAAVAISIADQAPTDSTGDALRRSANSVRGGAPAVRERHENELSAVIVQVDAGELGEDLTDAQIRVTMARRFYNDAVRDSRALRGRRLVRWLGLARRTPRPEYFEITERVTPA